jgi:tRNA G18 (ribose-2'-O)-methylase SpoU
MDSSPLTSIESLKDPRLEPYCNLRHRDPANDSACFIAEGRLVVERLLHSSLNCQSILVEHGHHQDLVDLAQKKHKHVQIFSTDLSTLRQLVGYDFHRGILACGIRPDFRPISELPCATETPTTMLVACGVNNPENIGGLMRTAAAFGVQNIAITSDVADPFSRRALRVSMAAAFRMQFWTMNQPSADCQFLATTLGYRTIATALDPHAMSIKSFRRDHRSLAILVGSEGDGLPRDVINVATDVVVIPMNAGTDSLNVNVATAIFLYELLA